VVKGTRQDKTRQIKMNKRAIKRNQMNKINQTNQSSDNNIVISGQWLVISVRFRLLTNAVMANPYAVIATPYAVIARSAATKQSLPEDALWVRDCFAALAMTARGDTMTVKEGQN
jgi:hypothetical protein